MDERLGRPPPDVAMTPLAERVFDVLAKYTAFPWPVLKTQTERCEVALETLDRGGLRRCIDRLARGVERFTSPESGALVRADLEKLAR